MNCRFTAIADAVASGKLSSQRVNLTQGIDKCRLKFASCTMPEHEDVLTLAEALQTQFVIVGKSLEPLQSAGEEGWPRLYLSNEQSRDGANQVKSHFRFLWSPERDLEDEVQKVRPYCTGL